MSPALGEDGIDFRRVAGIGCLGILLLVIVAGYVALSRWEKPPPAGLAGLVQAAPLPPPEKDAALAALRECRARADRAGDGIQAAEGGVLPVLVALRAAETAHLPGCGLPPGDVEAGRRTLARFSRGVRDGSILPDKAREIFSLLTVRLPARRGAGPARIKQGLSAAEMRQGLKIMRAAADVARVEDSEFALDLAAEIRRAFEAAPAAREDR